MTMTGVRRIAPVEKCPHPSDNCLPDNWPLDDCPHYYCPLPRLIAREDNSPPENCSWIIARVDNCSSDGCLKNNRPRTIPPWIISSKENCVSDDLSHA